MNQPILVLGVGRSGTSLVAWTLERLGVNLGGPERMIEPLAGDNPRGFFEHARISDLNERILVSLGGTWWDPPPLPPGWESSPGLDRFEDEARTILGEDFGDAGLWGWKDPRTSLTMPFWRRVVPAARFIVCKRDAEAVARSYRRHLSRRGEEVSDDALLRLPEHYTEAALSSAGSDPCLSIRYEDYVTDPLATLDELARFTGREAAAAETGLRADVLEFVAPPGGGAELASRPVSGDAPYPPLPLANRVGSLESAADPYAYYDELGLGARAGIEAGLPADWRFEGKTVLDFGCGAGRTLRHFLPEAETAEFWGCDIDAESIAWLDANLSPPFHVFENGPEPPLDVPDEKFDLVYAVSVFTHLVESWSSWLLELRRVLRPGGLLVATFMGEGMSQLIAGEEWDEARIGMNVIRYGQSWDLGGPMVLHSPWWIREHWGRGFEVVGVSPSGFGSGGDGGHGTAVLRKTTGHVTREELERVDPGDERELRALQHNVGQLRTEIADLRRTIDHERTLAAEVASTKQEMVDSRSWRLTEPLRKAGDLARRRPR